MTPDNKRKSSPLGDALAGTLAVLAGVAVFVLVSVLWEAFAGPIVVFLGLGETRSLAGDVISGVIGFGPMLGCVALAWIIAKGISGSRAANVAAAISFCLLVAFIAWSVWTANHI